MRTKTAWFLYFTALVFVGVLQLAGCQSPKKAAPTMGSAPVERTAPIVQESWQMISNRWGSVPLEKIKQAAETNDVTAQYYLAIDYSNGNGVAKDQAEAFKWMKLAAEHGMATAQRKLGWMFQDGLGTETNLDEAVVWYQKAAEQGDAQAQFNLGWMYENGVSVSQDYGEASKFYRLAADQGHSMAQNNLGFLYYRGFGVPQDSAEAMKWYQKSANQGEALGEENLGWMYRYANGDEPDYNLADKWMRLAAEHGSAEAEYQYGDLLTMEFDKGGHEIPTNFPVAAEWYKKAAEQGHAKAQYELAELYHTGKLGDDQRSNCIPWFLKAAAQGNADAQAEAGELKMYYPNSELAKMIDSLEMLRQGAENGSWKAQLDLAQRYQAGSGVPKDAVEAFKWMQKAAQSGVNEAIYDLALVYENGEGVTRDLSKAHDLFLTAAGPLEDSEDMIRRPDARFRVGQMYENGDGVPQDDWKAVEYYENIFYYHDFPERFPNGRLIIHGPTEKSIESLYRLWAEGRGFPSPEIKKLSGYAEPDVCIKNYWSRVLTTAKAEFYIGEIYYQGKLVPQDLVEADARFQFAANQGFDDAHKMLDELEPKMSQAQLEAAKPRLNSLEKLSEDVKRVDQELKRVDEAVEKLKRDTFK
jgi:hypothetical protein